MGYCCGGEMSSQKKLQSILEITDGDSKLGKEYIKITSCLDRNDVHKAYKIFKKLLKKYPKSDLLKCKYAALHGDIGQFIKGKKSIKMNLEAIAILEELMKKKLNPLLDYYVKNEFYYHSGRFKDQFLLGKNEAKVMKTGKRGSFSSGVGASEYGFELLLKGDFKEAKKYGKLSVWHWENSGRDLYMNCFYLQGLALSGQPQKALKLFKKQVSKYTHYKKQKVWFQLREQQLKYISKVS